MILFVLFNYVRVCDVPLYYLSHGTAEAAIGPPEGRQIALRPRGRDVLEVSHPLITAE